MTVSIHDLLKKDVKKMVHSLSRYQRGNIHSLIMQEVEKSLIALVLHETNHNYFQAARVLGISRSTLYRKIDMIQAKE